jgi:hypothetical protein
MSPSNFILFDQFQKHAVARIMSARVRHASTHPNTEDARKI